MILNWYYRKNVIVCEGTVTSDSLHKSTKTFFEVPLNF
jgi:hypothetical protein